jgi:hypothetical protein
MHTKIKNKKETKEEEEKKKTGKSKAKLSIFRQQRVRERRAHRAPGGKEEEVKGGDKKKTMWRI